MGKFLLLTRPFDEASFLRRFSMILSIVLIYLLIGWQMGHFDRVSVLDDGDNFIFFYIN